MTTKEQILDLYYNEHLKQNKIAEIVGTSTQYVSKIVKSDTRNKQEKENRKQQNSEKRVVYLQNYFKTYERPKKNDTSYEQMKIQQKQDALELSYHNELSDLAFAKWNSSAYYADKKGNLVLDKNLKVGFDVPKTINMNIKVPTQKYKHSCNY